MMYVIKVDGTVEEYDDKNDPVNLEAVQKAVGGYIEAVPYFNMYEGEPCQAWCDEEGKLKGYKFNREATNAWLKACSPTTHGDHLVGDICILTGSAMLD